MVKDWNLSNQFKPVFQVTVNKFDTGEMERCVMTYERCDVVFYHDGLENDKFFDEKVTNFVAGVINFFPFCIISLPLASTRWVQSTFSSIYAHSSNQCHRVEPWAAG